MPAAKLDALKASFQACFKNDDATTRSAGPSEVLSDRCSANNFSTALAEVMNGLQVPNKHTAIHDMSVG